MATEDQAPRQTHFLRDLMGWVPRLSLMTIRRPTCPTRIPWGPDDQLLADEIVDSLTTEGEILWALADQVGTIRDIGTWNDTSSEYEIANHRVYDSFGNLTDETNSSVDLAFGFTGRWTDPTTGLTHHLNRWFDSSIGKWLSNDPIGALAVAMQMSRATW